MTRTHKSLFSVAFAALLALPVLTYDAPSAQADVGIRVRGRVRVGGPRVVVRPRVVVHPRRYRVAPYRRYVAPPADVHLHVGGGVYWHGGVYVGRRFAAPPPPPPPADCNCEADPSYYDDGYYAPPAPAPAPAPVVAAPAEPPLPRWGLGVFAGSINIDDRVQGNELGLLGRVRLTDSLLVEAELAKTELDASRMDQRLGGALLYDFSPRSTFSFNILGGGGVSQSDVDGWHSQQRYGELGLGLTFRASRSLQFAADIRAGAREEVNSSPDSDALKSIAPEPYEPESFTRGRVSAILSF